MTVMGDAGPTVKNAIMNWRNVDTGLRQSNCKRIGTTPKRIATPIPTYTGIANCEQLLVLVSSNIIGCYYSKAVGARYADGFRGNAVLALTTTIKPEKFVGCFADRVMLS